MLFSSSDFSNGLIFRLKYFVLPTCIIFIPTWVSTQCTYSQGSMKGPSSMSLLLLQVTWFVPSFSPMQQMGAAAAFHKPHERLCLCIQCRPHVWTSASFLGCSGEACCTLSEDPSHELLCFWFLCTCHHLGALQRAMPFKKGLETSPCLQTGWEEYAGRTSGPCMMQLRKPQVM